MRYSVMTWARYRLPLHAVALPHMKSRKRPTKLMSFVLNIPRHYALRPLNSLMLWSRTQGGVFEQVVPTFQ